MQLNLHFNILSLAGAGLISTVVASDVRKLTERSQVAGKLLEEIGPAIRKILDLVQEISASSSEQAIGVGKINAVISQVSQTKQHNAAASEELSSTAEEMNSLAIRLQKAMTYFTLNTLDIKRNA